MVNLFVRYKVKDYTVWKAAFDSFIETRRAGGEKSYQIFQTDSNPNDVLLFLEWDSLANARTFMDNPESKRAMRAIGVFEAPDAYVLERYDYGEGVTSLVFTD
jgi:quinol monooxygenase YgiN